MTNSHHNLEDRIIASGGQIILSAAEARVLLAEFKETVHALRNICANRKEIANGGFHRIVPYMTAEDMQAEGLTALHRVKEHFA